ncbi:MAG TPA: ABC transporter permease [Candidatus Limnocylindrales bacterium]|nr:ABC transporter permease [Candidatus Limnocylindrales bacterium]
MTVLLGVLFYLPVGAFLARSFLVDGFSTDVYADLASRPIFLLIFLRTFRTGIIVTLVALVLAYPLAYAMARARPIVAGVATAIVLLPLWTSVLVRSYAWTVLLDDRGVINDILVGSGLLHAPLRILYTETAVWIGMVHILLPLMVLPIYSALRAIPTDLPQAASGLGASPRAVLRHVVLPLSLPGVFAGVVIVFISALGFFVTPAILGGPKTLMISTLITQQATSLLDWPVASAIALVLLVITMAIVMAVGRSLSIERLLSI